jgi:hypothetical protein
MKNTIENQRVKKSYIGVASNFQFKHCYKDIAGIQLFPKQRSCNIFVD